MTISELDIVCSVINEDHITQIIIMKTYRLGNLTSRNNRLLISNETNLVVGIAMTSCGPAYLGTMTEESRKENYPDCHLTLRSEKEPSIVISAEVEAE